MASSTPEISYSMLENLRSTTKKPRSVLYVGPLWTGSTALQRMHALEQLGNRCFPVDTQLHSGNMTRASIGKRIFRRLAKPIAARLINQRILEHAEQQHIDFCWIDKGLSVYPETCRTLAQKKIVLVGYSPDDMCNPHNCNSNFLGQLPLYDIFFTTKTFAVSELQALGCRHVEFVPNGFDPEIHKPYSVDQTLKQKRGGQIGFIGCYEFERAQSLRKLALQGLPVRVWGDGWEQERSPNLPQYRIENCGVWATEYAKTLCSFDINLCFLRKINRDLQTTRSVEIPACGAFMLAERTDEHLALFKEGVEADFFSSDEELQQKCRYYLANETVRKKIALAGYERCLKSGYSNPERMRHMVSAIPDLAVSR